MGINIDKNNRTKIILIAIKITYYVLYWWPKPKVSPVTLASNLLLASGLHHLIHNTDQGVHKGNDYEQDLDILGWSLTSIYFCPFAPPQSRENIRNAVHFTVRFCCGA